MIKHTLNSSLNKLSVDALTMQVWSIEIAASLVIVVIIWGNLRGRNDHVTNAIG